MAEAGKDWQRARAADVEQFAACWSWEQDAGVRIVVRLLSALSSFYE